MKTRTLHWPHLTESGEWDIDGQISREMVPVGAVVLGLAPIGIRWEAIALGNGKFRPDGNCPPREFAPCFALFDGKILEII